MSINGQMRRGMERIITIDGDTGKITRYVMADNGRGQLVSTGETSTHTVWCRVGYQAGGVWPARSTELGLTIDTTPYVLAEYDADLQQGDLLEWRDRQYTVGVVSRPELGGAPTCTQAPLVEVKE